jgi:hypothetical protein
MTAMTEQEQIRVLRSAVEKLIKAKGRFHTEQNYVALVQAFDATATTQPAAAPEPVAHMLPSDIKNLPELGHTTAFYSDVTNTTTGERSVPVYTAAPVQAATDEVLERIAESWDGCMYEAVGETLDIGAQLRKQFRALRTTSTDGEKGGAA